MWSASPRNSHRRISFAVSSATRFHAGVKEGRGNRWSRSVLKNDAGTSALANFTAHRLGFLPRFAADAGGVSRPCPEGTVAIVLDQRLFLVQRCGQGPDDRLEESHCHRLLEMSCQLRTPRRPSPFCFEFQRLEAPRIGTCDTGVLERFLPVEAQIDRRRRVVPLVLCRTRRGVIAGLLRQASGFQERPHSAFPCIVGSSGQAEIAEPVPQVIEIFGRFLQCL